MQSACNQACNQHAISAHLRREFHLQLHYLLVDIVFMHHLGLRRAVTGTVLDAGSRRAGIPPDEGGNQPDEGGNQPDEGGTQPGSRRAGHSPV
jgi:hypothetical protein